MVEGLSVYQLFTFRMTISLLSNRPVPIFGLSLEHREN